MSSKSIAIIGSGNMGGCIISGLIKNDYPKENIWIADPSAEKLNIFSEVNTTTSNKEAANNSKIIILAVKPTVLPLILREIADEVRENNSLVISVAAGVTTKIINNIIGEKNSIIRAMPNTPAMLGCGATALFAGENVKNNEKDTAESIFRTVGATVWINEENQMDAVTALSGSGPAYFFLIMEAMQDAGIKLGLSAETAKLLTIETAFGAGRMALESNSNLKELREQVTSPKGTTERAINSLESANIREIFADAIKDAETRAKEITNMLEQEMEQSND